MPAKRSGRQTLKCGFSFRCIKNNNPKLVHYEKVQGNESLSESIDNISDNVFAQL